MQKYVPASLVLDGQQMTRHDDQEVSAAVLSFVKVAEKVSRECFERTPPKEAAAWRLFYSDLQDNSVGANFTMECALLSGFDHARAFVALIRTPTVRSTALATTARGAMESFARAFHLLDCTDDLDFVYRSISLLRGDLYYPWRLGKELTTRGGDPVDVSELRAHYASELARLGLPEARKTTLAGMVEVMLDSQFEGSLGAEMYSSVSSIAHAHRSAINIFVTTSERGDVNGLAAPRQAVIGFATYVLASLSASMPLLVDWFGGDQRQKDLIMTAAIRGGSAMEALAAERP